MKSLSFLPQMPSLVPALFYQDPPPADNAPSSMTKFQTGFQIHISPLMLQISYNANHQSVIIVFLPHVEWNNECFSWLLENSVLTMNICEAQSIYIFHLSKCRYGTMEVRQRIWLYGMRFWLLYTVQLLQSMKWLCEVRLGPIYSETQGSPHSVDDESFSNKVSRNSSSSLKSYHLHCNQYLCSISTSTVKYSRESSYAHDLQHQSHHVSNQPSWVGGWAV